MIQVVWGQEGLFRELCQPLLVPDMVMQREDRINIFPLSVFGCYVGTSFDPLRCNQSVYHAQSFSFGEGSFLQRADRLFDGLNLTDTM